MPHPGQVANRDQNYVPGVIVTDFSDATQTVEVKGDPATGRMLVNTTGTVTLSGGKLVTVTFDYIAATYPDTSTEVYTYKSGGSGGTTVATVTVVYSDAGTKQIITSVTRT